MKVVSAAVNLLGETNVGRYAFDRIVSSSMQSIKAIKHRQTSLSFVVPNRINEFRVNSFLTKEPETLDWIGSIPEGSLVWDVGANVGLYSYCAAKSRNLQVYAFEPLVFNLELLAKNIYINDLHAKVISVPLPLADSLKISTLNVTSTEWGGTLYFL